MCDKSTRTDSESSTDTAVSVLTGDSECCSNLINNKQQGQSCNACERQTFTSGGWACLPRGRRAGVKQWCGLVVICAVVSVVSSFIVSLVTVKIVMEGHRNSDEHSKDKVNDESSAGTMAKLKGSFLCFECSHLKVYVDDWAWKGVTRNPISDKCCFKDKFSVMQTLKFYTDVKLSEVKSNLDLANSEIKSLYRMFYTANANSTNGNDGNDTQGLDSRYKCMLPPDVRKMLGDLMQKKRSALHLSSDQLLHFEKSSTIKWSTSALTSPILQGGLEMVLYNSRVKVAGTGIYTVRLEIQIVVDVPTNNNTKEFDVTCQLKGYGENDVGLSWIIDTFTETVKVGGAKPHFYGVIDTMTRLKKGDSLGVECPKVNGKSFLSTGSGVHRITLTEEA